MINKKISFTFYVSMLFLSLVAVNIFYPNLSFSQLNNQSQKFQVSKTSNDEIFILPFNATNTEIHKPTEYVFKDPKQQNWIVLLSNNLTYSNNPDSKTVVKLNEPYPSKKFVELTLLGNGSNGFFVAINTNETGYMQVYQKNQDGWEGKFPIIISHANVQGLSVSNGKRIIVDKLSLNGFNLGSVDVYGKDQPGLSNSAVNGLVKFEVMSGDPSKSPLYYMPAIVMAGVGGIVIALVVLKKRR